MFGWLRQLTRVAANPDGNVAGRTTGGRRAARGPPRARGVLREARRARGEQEGTAPHGRAAGSGRRRDGGKRGRRGAMRTQRGAPEVGRAVRGGIKGGGATAQGAFCSGRVGPPQAKREREATAAAPRCHTWSWSVPQDYMYFTGRWALTLGAKLSSRALWVNRKRCFLLRVQCVTPYDTMRF